MSINSSEVVIESIEVVVHSGTNGVHANGGVESLLGSIEESASDALLLVGSGSGERELGTLVLVEIVHCGGGKWITLVEVEDGVGSIPSMELSDISNKVLEAIELSVNSSEVIIKGVKVVVHSSSDGVHANSRVKSLLGSIEESASDALLLIGSGSSERELGTLVLVEIIHCGGGEWITLVEIKDGVGSIPSMELSDICNKVLEAKVSVNSSEVIIKGVKVVIHSSSDGIHTFGGIESLLGSVKESASDFLLLIGSGSSERELGTLVFVEILNPRGFEWIAICEVEDGVGTILSVEFIDFSFEVGQNKILISCKVLQSVSELPVSACSWVDHFY